MNWELRLQDEISGPARKMASSLGSVHRNLRRVDEAARSVKMPDVGASVRPGSTGGGGRSGGAGSAREAMQQARLQLQQQRLQGQQAAQQARQRLAEQREQRQVVESRARLEARAQATAGRAAQSRVRDGMRAQVADQRVQAGIRRRQARELAASARLQQAGVRQENRRVAAENASRIKAEYRAQRAMAGAGGGAGGQGQSQMFDLPGQAGMLLKIAAAAVTAALAVGALGAAFSKVVLNAVDFRDGTIKAIDTLTKKTGEGARAFDMSINLAARFNLDPQEAVKSVHSLISKGFTADESKVLITAMADLKVLSPNANLDKVSLAIEQIKGKGKLQMEELQGQLAEAGVSVSLVLDQLAKKYKKSSDEIRKMISAGKIDAKEGVDAIVAAITQMGTGKLGEAAENAARSSVNGLVDGIRMRLSLLPLEMAKALSGSAGVEAVKGALRNVLDALNPEKSPEMQGLIANASAFADTLFQAIFGDAASASAGTTLQKILQGVSDGFRVLTAVVEVVGPIVSGLLGGFGEVLGEVYQELRQAGSELGAAFGGDKASMLKQLGLLARSFGRMLAYVVVGVSAVATAFIVVQGAVLAMAAAFQTAFLSISAMVDRLIGAFGELQGMLMGSGTTAGEYLWQGLRDGILSGLGAVNLAGVDLANSAKSGVTSTLAIQSPSRVMEEMGGYTAQGFVQGVEGGQSDVNAAMSATVAPPTGARAPGGGATGGGAVFAPVVNVYVQGGADASTGQAVADSVMEPLRQLFEEWLSQSGGGPAPITT